MTRNSWLARIMPYVSIARPDHWCKNVFMALGVILAAFCYPELLSHLPLVSLVLALVATCLLASSNYVLNEILDAPTDKAHPVKKFRPIPSGLVSLPVAYALWIVIGLCGLLLAALVNVPFLCAGLSLLIMGVIYNVPPIRSKEHPYIDVLSESVNNPIRLLLGWFAVTPLAIPPVSLLIAYWMLGAFFMAAKRLAEYRSLGDPEVARAYRSSFRRYNERKLLLSMFFYTTTFALFMGVFVIRYHLELIFSFPFIAGFLCYYLRVAFKKESAAQKPEKLYREKSLMGYLVVCVGVFLVLMFVRIPLCYEWFNVRPSPVPVLWTIGKNPSRPTTGKTKVGPQSRMQDSRAPIAPDVYLFAGLPPEKAASVMTVPEDFEVKLCVAEPQLHQPIALCLDDRGRVWVAEAYSYPVKVSAMEAKDRILIFEDTDGDGKFDNRTVFIEGLNLVSGLELGFGGVWIGTAPDLLFIPREDGADKPSGPAQVLLDGWGYQDTHETLNSFNWGPDGWLYGCHGVFTHSRVGKPGTADGNRVPIDGGIWRYHPTRHVFEVFAHGTSNPWGLDFNDFGQAFCSVCVLPHCFHIIQGARYKRQVGNHFNPYTFADIPSIADHHHYGNSGPHHGNQYADSFGGGHAHSGAMIYLGGVWPTEYRGRMFMGNIHGCRLNMDVLHPKGSGYVASHGKDFLLANDSWAKFVNMRYGPDGNVYLLDWYDRWSCHTPDPQMWDKTNGRIYKICYRGGKPVAGVDLSQKTNEELVQLQLHPNDWYVRHARRILQERSGSADPSRRLDPEVVKALERLAFEHKDETRRLRGLWALHAVRSALDERTMARGLNDESPWMRAWTIQLALEQGEIDDRLLERFAELARSDDSPIVRLYLAAGLQRVAVERRWEVLASLLSHTEDRNDGNLPLMYWYAAEPLAEVNTVQALDLAANSQVPLLTYMARRIASPASPEALALLTAYLGKLTKNEALLAMLKGINAALQGRGKVDMPTCGPTVFAHLLKINNTEVQSRVKALAVTFGDRRATNELRQLLTDSKAALDARRGAIASLLGVKDEKLAPVLQTLLDEASLRREALRGLAAYDDPATASKILAVYSSMNPSEKHDALSTLASRSAYGHALLDAVVSKQVPAGDVSADVVRQLRNLEDSELKDRIGQVWGTLRETSMDRKKLIAEWRAKLTSGGARPNLSLGRAVFNKTCAQCHQLYGVGGFVGPDITGHPRANLDYLLENILDPSAVIPSDFQTTRLTLTNGRVITGLVKAESKTTVTILTANESLTVLVADIDSRYTGERSMMPDDLLKGLTDDEVFALLAYLQSSSQVPLPVTME